MSVFPRISLKPEVMDFLQGVFLNKEVGVYMCFLGSSYLIIEINHVPEVQLFDLIFSLLLLSRFCSGVSCNWPSGGRVSFPEAAHVPVSPSFLYLCPGQHSSSSAGRDQTQVGRRAEKGEFSPSCVFETVAVSQVLINRYVVVKAADVQLISRGGSDSYSPTNSRCAAPSCRWTQVCEEFWDNVR